MSKHDGHVSSRMALMLPKVLPQAPIKGSITTTTNHYTHLVSTCLPRHILSGFVLSPFPQECEQRCSCQRKYGLGTRPEQCSGRNTENASRGSRVPSSATQDQCHLSSQKSFNRLLFRTRTHQRFLGVWSIY